MHPDSVGYSRGTHSTTHAVFSLSVFFTAGKTHTHQCFCIVHIPLILIWKKLLYQNFQHSIQRMFPQFLQVLVLKRAILSFYPIVCADIYQDPFFSICPYPL